MIKLVNTLRKQADGVQTCLPENLKLNVSLDPQKTFNDQIIVKVDTGADVNCINEKTFYSPFPEVKSGVLMSYRLLETLQRTLR